MSPGTLANHKSLKRGPGQVTILTEIVIFHVKKGGLKMETPVETFGFGSQIEEMGFYTPLVPGGRGGFQRLRLMPPTWG
jgi:hypothetical protein